MHRRNARNSVNTFKPTFTIIRGCPRRNKGTANNKSLRGRHKAKNDFLKSLLITAKYHQLEELSTWSNRARTLLTQVGSPPKTDVTDEFNQVDISVSGAQAATEYEMIEKMIEHRLATEDLRHTEPAQLMPDIEEVAPISTYENMHSASAAKLITQSAKLFNRYDQSTFQTANNKMPFTVYTNMLGGNPHKRWIKRIESHHSGVFPEEPTMDYECVMPDLSQVPEELRRVDPNEVIISVAVCTPQGNKEQEFDVLCSQRLYELRDALHFATDYMFDGPTRLKSACFFIDGIFYSDKRDPTAIDYGDEIIQWLKVMQPDRLRHDATLSMDCRFADLERIPLGTKCVYIHQGDIEQPVYFTNIRLMNMHNDCPLVVAYPLLTFMRPYKKRKCDACWQNAALWIVLDSSRCPHNPSFWCSHCFRHFFQDAAGDFLPPIDYKVFPYLHDDT